MLNWLKRKLKRKVGGVLIAWVVYKPEEEQPNVYFNLHPDMREDELLHENFKGIAEHIRTYYGDLEF